MRHWGSILLFSPSMDDTRGVYAAGFVGIAAYLLSGNDVIYKEVCADVEGKANTVEPTKCVLNLGMLLSILFFFLSLVCFYALQSSVHLSVGSTLLFLFDTVQVINTNKISPDLQ